MGLLERKDPLEREVVDGEERSRARALRKAQVHGRERRRPIVAVNDLGPPRDGARPGAEEGGDAAENAEAQRVVLPVGAVVVLVGSAAARVERGSVEDDERDAVGKLRFEQAHLRAERRETRDLARLRVRLEHGRIAGQQHAHVDAERVQRGGQRRAHVAQPAGLHERGALGSREEYAQRGISRRRRQS